MFALLKLKVKSVNLKIEVFAALIAYLSVPRSGTPKLLTFHF